MKTTLKIKELWDYLKVQDDEVLIVRLYNPDKDSDEFIVTEKSPCGLSLSIYDFLPCSQLNKPFRLVQQLDSDGRHIIPSVKQLRQDEIFDY